MVKFPITVELGSPPVQMSERSPTRSVNPSERTVRGTAEVWQVNGPANACPQIDRENIQISDFMAPLES
jgi:hypothetical protein